MATVQKQNEKKVAKPAASAKKAAPKKASKPAVKQSKKAADPIAAKFVMNIVEVESKDIKKTAPTNKGVSQMTKATEKKTENTAEKATEAATSFFADVRERATNAANKGRELVAEAGTITRANLEAVTESGKIAAKGAQELGKENIDYAKTNFEEAQSAAKSLVAVKSPTEFVQVQTEVARKSFDTLVSQGSKNTESMIKLAGDIFQPLSNRMAVVSDLLKKAA